MAKRVDKTQSPIVDALREIGASVAITSMVGHGFVDAVVGFRGVNFLFEIKTPSPIGWKLTPAQKKFHAGWNGTIHIVDSVELAIAIVTGGANE